MASDNTPDYADNILYLKDNKRNVYCGYKLDYLNMVLNNELYICKKCAGIMREPCCIKGELSCLDCSRSRKKHDIVGALQDSISKLEIKCPLLRDCAWKGFLSEAEEHLRNCVHFRIQCVLCKQTILRGEREQHETDLCQMRIVKCQNCHKEQIKKNLIEHYGLCEEFPILCPNKCETRFLRKKLSQHRSVCELEEIACPYARYGCDAKPLLRKHLSAHKVEYLVKHQDASFVEIQQLGDTIARLELSGKMMRQFDGVELKVESAATSLEAIEGPSFYVNNYHLKVYYTVQFHPTADASMLRIGGIFHLRRIEGRFDELLGVCSITQYKILITNEEDLSKSFFKEGSMEYPLLIGQNSEQLFCSYDVKKCSLLCDRYLSVKLCFDVSLI